MALLDPVVFEEPVMSDEEIQRIKILNDAGHIYDAVRTAPGKWAKFGEQPLLDEGQTGTEEDQYVSLIYNALNNYYARGFERNFPRCETKIQRVDDIKHYYAKYRRMFH